MEIISMDYIQRSKQGEWGNLNEIKWKTLIISLAVYCLAHIFGAGVHGVLLLCTVYCTVK
jgi:hypothetical protein